LRQPVDKKDLDVAPKVQGSWRAERDKLKKGNPDPHTKGGATTSRTRGSHSPTSSPTSPEGGHLGLRDHDWGVFGLDVDLFSDIGPKLIEIEEQIGRGQANSTRVLAPVRQGLMSADYRSEHIRRFLSKQSPF
jgi:hypothetical protein